MPDGSSHAPNAPAPAAAAKADEPAKKHMMYSSWQSKPQSEWTFSQRVLARLDVLPNMPGQKAAPIKKIGDPIPVWTMSSQAMIAIPWTVPPIALHWAYMKFTGNTVHPVAAYLLYTAAYNLLSLFTTQKTNKMGLKYGFFDSAVKRDGVPDARTDYVLFEVLKVVLLRPLLGLILAYNREEVPSISILFPLKLAAFSMVLDFFFYTYHRAMHEVDFLWRFHSLHHRTKHPVSLLSAFADWEQEIVDAFGVPALTYLVMMNVPYLTVNYFEAFACMMFIVTAESGGHSGARVYATSPCNGWILRPLGMELCLEDHDLHHRQGWKKSGNYGKQTRMWDVIFGTCKPRIESQDQYIDWNWHATLADD